MFYVLSDIHLEFFKKSQVDTSINWIKNKLIDPDSYLILAGDICSVSSKNFEYFFSSIQSMFKKIFYVLGNHEFYNSDITTTKNLLATKLEELNNNNNNIILLDNSSYYLQDANILIVGSTLWSDLTYNNDNIWKAKYMINDFNYINNFSVDEYQNYFKKDLKYLEDEIQQNMDKRILVVTHHVPTYELIDKKYKNDPMNICFASELNHLFQKPIIAWIYGHTHTASEKIINNIKFKCNPIGYVGENKTFKIIDQLDLSNEKIE